MNNADVSEDMQSIGQKYRSQEFEDFFMKAPDGTESNYSLLQWTLIRTDKFKKLFGDWETEFQKRLFDINYNNAVDVDADVKNVAERKDLAKF